MLDVTSLNSELARASESIAQSRKHVEAAPPHTLFHYTNSGGMRGILDSSRLWATDYRFLNDASEVSYAMKMFTEVVEERLTKSTNEINSEFLRRTLRTVNLFDGMFDCYVTCFCERDDLLNQWRVYADAGGGYALGFNAKQIGLRVGKLKPAQDFMLRKVVYEEQLQRRLLAEVIDYASGALMRTTEGSSVDASNTAIALCCQFVRAEAADYLICFKHPAFAVEEEWRLCHLVAPGDDGHVLFRDGIYGLTPYVALDPSPMAGVHMDKLPLVKITHGPASDPSNIRFALAKLLKAKGYPFTHIEGSMLPLRVGP